MAVELGAKWQLDAALLSRPVDLTTLVAMSKSSPDQFFVDDSLHRMVKILLNESDERRSDHQTKLDVLNILGNLANFPERRGELKVVLQGVSEWFDDYLNEEPLAEEFTEPLLHKAMVVLLSRTFEYSLKTEDLLDLNNDNRQRALITVVSLLEEGESCTTKLTQRRTPGEGHAAQWERKVVFERYEKPMILQLARLLKGFTHPTAYFSKSMSDDGDIALHTVDEFSDEINGLLSMSLETRLVQKLSAALYDSLFGDEDTSPCILDEAEHHAMACVHAFLQNLYLYGTTDTAEYRQNLLMDPMLIPHLILPYIDMAVLEATLMHNQQDISEDEGKYDDRQESGLVEGLAASLKTLIIASFRATPTRSMMDLLREFNPTQTLLTAEVFIRRHPKLLALICLLNVNMNALDLAYPLLSGEGKCDDSEEDEEESDKETRLLNAYLAHSLLHDLALFQTKMTLDAQLRVLELVLSAGGLPVARDCASYMSVLSVLHGGCGNQNNYLRAVLGHEDDEDDDVIFNDDDSEGDAVETDRSEQKSAASERYAQAQKVQQRIKDERCVPIEAARADSQFRLLGDLPSLDQPAKDRIEMELVLPDGRSGAADAQSSLAERIEEATHRLAQHSRKVKKHHSRRRKERKAQRTDESKREQPNEEHMQRADEILRSSNQTSYVPKQYTCAINGHIMKEPLKSPYGHHFEKSTIDLWLSTNGNICPITHKSLKPSELVPDQTLRSEIIRWQIQRTNSSLSSGAADDLYDF